MNINKAIVIGRITKDLELKVLPSGVNILNFSVATNYNYKDASGNKVETTDFHNVVAFNRSAENIAQYFIKGQEIYIEGRLKTSSWDDKESGKKMYKTEIFVEKWDFGQRPKGSENTAPAQNNNDINQFDSKKVEYPTDDVNPEDIPF